MPTSLFESITQNRSLLYFIAELRTRLIYCLLFFSVILIGLLPFTNYFYTQFAAPFLQSLPIKNYLIATTFLMPLWVTCQLSFFLAFLMSLPFFLYQFWQFVKPALYSHEKRIFAWFLFLSGGLFYSGIGVGYQFILPILFRFFLRSVPASVLFLPTIEAYLHFTVSFLFLIGLLFEVPLWMIWFARSHRICLQKLQGIRRYYIIFAFILAMLLTPPDVLCQILVAIPLCLFFEIGLLFCRYLPPRQNSCVKNQPKNGF